MNDRLLKALKGENRGRPPVWLMRQAGRYMPQYRAIRKKYSFETMCQTPEIAAEVTLLPIDLLGVDAAIIFSDILVVADAMGLGVHIKSGVGPVIERPVKDVEALFVPEVKETLGYVAEALQLVKPCLNVPLIGFAGAPFTVASYMVEKLDDWIEEPAFHTILDKVTQVTIDYLLMQKQAGADVLQLFDSWALKLSKEQYASLSLPYIKRIVEAVQGVPLILYSRGPYAFDLAALHPTAISVDSSYDLTSLPQGVAVQGNLDGDVIYQPLDEIEKQVGALLETMRGHPAYIFNVGQGLRPDMSMEAVRKVVDTVKEFG